MVAARTDNTHRSTRTPALGLRFLLLAALSIVLLIYDHRENHLDAVRKTLGAAVYPLRIVVDSPVSLWRWARESTAARNDLLLLKEFSGGAGEPCILDWNHLPSLGTEQRLAQL